MKLIELGIPSRIVGRRALVALAASAFLACGPGAGAGADVVTGADATPDAAPDASPERVQSCVRIAGTCQEFHGIPEGDVMAVCSTAPIVNAPCTRTDAVGGCRKEYTVGYYITWGYSDGSAFPMTAETVRSFCADEMPPGTFVAP